MLAEYVAETTWTTELNHTVLERSVLEALVSGLFLTYLPVGRRRLRSHTHSVYDTSFFGVCETRSHLTGSNPVHFVVHTHVQSSYQS